jgi:hypothetical protein
MSAESTYSQTLSSDSTLNGIISDRIYPVKFPQNVAYPSLMYRVEADIDGLLDVSSDPSGVFDFENTFNCSSYSQVIAITEALKNICSVNDWNISHFIDNDYNENTQTFSRTLNIIINSNL